VSNWKLDADIVSIQLKGPFAAGSEGITITRSFGNVEWRLVDVEPQRSATVELPLPGATAQFHWTFEDYGVHTRITQRVTISGEHSSPLIEGLVANLGTGIPAGMQKLSDAIAEAARHHV
jgi:hypothetical protein